MHSLVINHLAWLISLTLEKFPGKRGIHTWATGIVEKAMVADGVKPTAVPTVLEKQTGALDRAFAKLDTIKDHIVFWSSGSKPLELVKSGEVVMAIAYNGRVGAANLAEGENFEYIWEGQVLRPRISMFNEWCS